MGEVDSDALEAVKVRWRFGDGSADVDSGTSLSTSYKFLFCGEYEVMTEVTDRNHNVAVAATTVTIDADCVTPLKTLLPIIHQNR